MDLWKILLGAFVAALLFYFRESFKKTQQKKLILTRLLVHLHDAIDYLDSDVFRRYYNIGIDWHNEEKNALLEKNNIALDEINKKYLNLSNTTEALPKDEMQALLSSLTEKIRNLPQELFDYEMKKIEKEIDLYNTNTFPVNDDEAALISIDTLAKMIQVRKIFVLADDEMHSLQMKIRYSDNINNQLLIQDYQLIMSKFILLSKNVHPLLEDLTLMNKKNTIRLMIEDMLNFT